MAIKNNLSEAVIKTASQFTDDDLKDVKSFKGSNNLPISDKEQLTSFGGFCVVVWTNDDPTASKKSGKFMAASINGKKLPLAAFSKIKFIINEEGKAVEITAKGGFAEHLRTYPDTLTQQDLIMLENYINTAITQRWCFSVQYYTNMDKYVHQSCSYNALPPIA